MASNRIQFKYTEENRKLIPYLRVVFHYRWRKTPPIDSILDSGSDSVSLPMALAKELKLPLRKLDDPIETAGGNVEGYESSCSFEIVLGQGQEPIRFKLVSVVVVKANIVPLIGRNPLFEKYKVLFEEKYAKFSLQRE